MPNRATEIVLTNFIDILDSCGGNGWGRNVWNAMLVEDLYLTMMEDGSDDYDADWFALVATEGIRDTIDWNYCAEKGNDFEFNMEVEYLFGEEQ